MTLFRNKYRIESMRLRCWDYSSPGAYFVTIVTKNRECYFGNVENGIMNLNETGEIAKQYFAQIPKHFLFVSVDTFVVMPNHVHGIVIINQSDVEETLHATSLQPLQPSRPSRPSRSSQPPSTGKSKTMSSISPKSGSLSTIIRSFKSAVTRSSRLISHDFAWQSRYYDRIIRNECELGRIRTYIIKNPLNWAMDEDNPEKMD